MNRFEDIRDFFVAMDTKTKVILTILLCALILFLAYILLDKYSIIGEKENSNQHNSNPPVDTNTDVDTDTDTNVPDTTIDDSSSNKLYFYYSTYEGKKIVSSTMKLSEVNTANMIGSYTCKADNCNAYQAYAYEPTKGEVFVIIEDGTGSFIYNLAQNLKVSKNYTSLECMNDELYSTTKFYCAAEVTLNNYELMTLGGYVIAKDFEAIGLNMGISRTFYSYDLNKDIVTAKKNGKWGIINISTGKVVVDYKYEAAEILDNGRVIFKLSGKYYLSDIKESIASKTAHDTIVKDYGTYMIVIDSNYLDIVDYDGNSIIDSKLKLNNPFVRYPYEGILGVAVSEITNNIITIRIEASGNAVYEYDEYEYNVLTKKVKLIKASTNE